MGSILRGHWNLNLAFLDQIEMQRLEVNSFSYGNVLRFLVAAKGRVTSTWSSLGKASLMISICSSSCHPLARRHICVLNTGYPRSKPISIGFSPQSHELNSHNWGAIHHFQSQMDCNQTATKESFGQCNGWRSLLYFMGCSSDALK